MTPFFENFLSASRILLNKYLEIFKKSCHGNLWIRKFPVIRKYLQIRNFPVVRKKIYGSVSEAGEFGLGLVWICSNHDFIFFFCLKSSILWCSTLCIKLNYFIAGSKFAFSFSNLDILASLKKVNNVKLLVIFFLCKKF